MFFELRILYQGTPTEQENEMIEDKTGQGLFCLNSRNYVGLFRKQKKEEHELEMAINGWIF